MPIQLVVGLQNPGASYQATRHNAGGWFVEALAKESDTVFKIEKTLHSEIAIIVCGKSNLKVVLPLNFMNHNGQSVRAVSQFFRILPEHILIVHDDLDILPGRAKLKTGGGHGGHNGIRDIIQHLGTPNFHRLRIGIGHPGHRDDVLDYVLGKPSCADKKKIDEVIDTSLSLLPLIVSDQWPLAMNILGTRA
jgi:PTH1 family peptidyl-tRNA hydrolase